MARARGGGCNDANLPMQSSGADGCGFGALWFLFGPVRSECRPLQASCNPYGPHFWSFEQAHRLGQNIHGSLRRDIGELTKFTTARGRASGFKGTQQKYPHWESINPILTRRVSSIFPNGSVRFLKSPRVPKGLGL